MILPTHPFGTEISLNNLSERLSHAQGWEAKNRLLVQLARELPEFPIEMRDDAHRISGCESQVWLWLYKNDVQIQIAADGDSKIIKGLLALVLAAYHGKTAEEISQFDFTAWLNELGLQRFLSASRGNGLKAIVNHIKNQANL
ncbi:MULTISPECIES: SufE family protein [Deefgea]|uniref:Fe-S metabolism protein SufE n=1 Tax=Deefgea chitinilytica TaxID=570276 RepID=A0ABS2C9K5_9NEIS|nr:MULTISPECIES: SufE family protein [Deefgea]MBM5570834.1 Fe-S metabolism protein SufE [Deefgea chitinilytica]MBM9888063.1 SufE family protein [Deefgea sp. CFH1-16]